MFSVERMEIYSNQRSVTPRGRKLLYQACFAGIVACLVHAGFVLAQPVPPVVTASIVRGKVQSTLQFSGTLVSLNEARLSAEAEGRVIGVADVGTRFFKDEVIAWLDDTLMQQVLVENQAEVQSRKERLRFLQNEVRRLQKLAKSNNAAISLLEETQANLGVTRSELAAASARVAQTREKIRRLRIAAPFAGVISEVYTETGEWLSVGDSIVDLVDTEALEVETHVSANVLAHISVGDLIEVKTGNGVYKTRLQVIVPVGDRMSRLFELRLTPNETIGPPGLAVQVFLPVTSSRDGLLAPEDALIIRRDGVSVFRIEADMTASRVPVRVGLSARNGLVEIIGDLEAGNRVVIRGGERLRDGSTVRVVPPVDDSKRNSRDSG